MAATGINSGGCHFDVESGTFKDKFGTLMCAIFGNRVVFFVNIKQRGILIVMWVYARMLPT